MLSALVLSGCANSVVSSSQSVSLAPPPVHVKQCFEQMTPIPVARVEAILAQAQAGDVAAQRLINREGRKFIVALRRSEARKSRCGRQLLAFYNRVKARAKASPKS